MRTISIGYSPCPNDTFIFYALTHGKIDTGSLNFKELLLDVETLNRMALNAELDLSKVSYHAYGHLRDRYTLLRAGGALGRGCGPLVVTKHNHTMEDLRKGKKIAIPGRLTTAFLLLQLYDPAFRLDVSGHIQHSSRSSCIEMPFHQVMEAVANDEADAGLIIHESRFTYPSYGLQQLLDLGEWWEKDTGLPIPLGCIIGRKEIEEPVLLHINSLIRNSIEYAFNNRHEPEAYIKLHSQELSYDVIARHIALYVNDHSLDIGADGQKAVNELFRRSEDAGILPRTK